MIHPVDLEVHRPPSVQVGAITAGWRWWLSVRWTFRSRIEVFRGILGIAGVVLAVLFWLVLVVLLVQQWASWWAELESYTRSTDFMPTRELQGAFE